MGNFGEGLSKGLGTGVGLIGGLLVVKGVKHVADKTFKVAKKVRKESKGWMGESQRHALARKRIKTVGGRKERMRKDNQYEVAFEWVGRGKRPAYVASEYGFGSNPPAVIYGKSKEEALATIKLPKTVRVAWIGKVE